VLSQEDITAIEVLPEERGKARYSDEK